MAQKEIETLLENLKTETKARFVGLFDALDGSTFAASGDSAGQTGKNFIFEIKLRPGQEEDTLTLTRTRVYCRIYRIWFRPNHVLGVIIGDKDDVGPVRDKARAAVAKLKPMLGG